MTNGAILLGSPSIIKGMKVVTLEGFTYNGIHSSEYNCYYIPDASDRWFASPEFEVYEKEVPGRPGGYGYGTRTKIRTLTLKVFFENITKEMREKIRSWLTEDSLGELVLDERPFIIYRSVQLKKTIPGKLYTTQDLEYPHDVFSGTFTIEFSLYEPYGYLKYKYYTSIDEDLAGFYCGMLEKNEMPSVPSTSSRSFLMYNPGTETCETLIRIGGSVGSGGLTIMNQTNGTECKILSLPSSGYLEIDSFHGAIVHVNGESRTLNFEYHDEGYMNLAPYGRKLNDVVATTTSGSSTVTLDNCKVDKYLVGSYIR